MNAHTDFPNTAAADLAVIKLHLVGDTGNESERQMLSDLAEFLCSSDISERVQLLENIAYTAKDVACDIEYGHRT